jgi:hypothetical protein
MCILSEVDMGNTVNNSAGSWLLKYILPIIIIPIISSYIISYGAVRSMETQQLNDGKRIDQVVKETNRNSIEISRNIQRISKLEILIETVNKTLSRQADLYDKNLTEMRKIRSSLSDLKESVAVLKDRENRDKS